MPLRSAEVRAAQPTLELLIGLFVLLGAVTTTRCRSAVSIGIATLGLGGNEEARSAARIIFADLGKPLTSPGESELPRARRARDTTTAVGP